MSFSYISGKEILEKLLYLRKALLQTQKKTTKKTKQKQIALKISRNGNF